MDLLLTHGYYLEEDPAEKYPYPPLGILYLSSHLKQHAVDVEIFDTTFRGPADFGRLLAERRPPIVGISGNLRTRRNVLAMTRVAKQHGAIVVLGGPEPYSYREKYLTRGADAVIGGEGELTLDQLVPHLLEHGPRDLQNIPGIAFRAADGEIVENAARPTIEDLDAQPFPDRGAIDIARYQETWRRERGQSAVSLITARGCAYRCTWCSHSVFGFTHRRRSPQNVADEVESIVETYGPDMLWYADDVFTVHHRWISEYAAELENRGLRLPFEAISREDRLDEEVIRTLADMGCFRLWVGAESGSQRILDAMGRRTNAERMREVIGLLQRHGIEAGTFIMLGYEGETARDIAATIDYLKAAAPDTYLTTLAYPIKGTEYYRQVADRVVSPTSWEEGSDRDLTIAGRRSQRYYRFAIRWLVNEVASSRQRGYGPRSLGRRLVTLLNATVGRLGMLHDATPSGASARSPGGRPGVVAGAHGDAPANTVPIVSGDAFDAVASSYDDDFTDHSLGRLLRSGVRRELEESFRPGSRVLDLGCGTGEDAVWMARRGISVAAVDGSNAMLARAREKAERAEATDRVTWHRIDLAAPDLELAGLCGDSTCDGAYSNFGALNCVPDLHALAGALARQVRPGGRLLLVIMGPICPWEVAGHLARGRVKDAFRRLRRRAQARVGDHLTIRVWYPSPRRVRRDFEPWFRPLKTVGVGVILPPTDFRNLVDRWPRLFASAAALEKRVSGIFPATWLNDHHLTIFERR